MGMFDDVSVFMPCPFCGRYGMVEAQTKDLESCMYHYRPLADDWLSSQLGKKFREGLWVFPKFPLDKGHSVWQNQAERIEAEATPSAEFGEQLKYINAYGKCPNCKKRIEGKIKLQDGKLIGDIYDVVGLPELVEAEVDYPMSSFLAKLNKCNKCGEVYMVAHQDSKCPHERIVDKTESPTEEDIVSGMLKQDFIVRMPPIVDKIERSSLWKGRAYHCGSFDCSCFMILTEEAYQEALRREEEANKEDEPAICIKVFDTRCPAFDWTAQERESHGILFVDLDLKDGELAQVLIRE